MQVHSMIHPRFLGRDKTNFVELLVRNQTRGPLKYKMGYDILEPHPISLRKLSID